jgi:rhamnogalacturonyl hydrolase YesR
MNIPRVLKILLPLLFIATLPVHAQIHYESDGLVVIEAESQPPGSRFDFETRVPGFKGSGYFRGNLDILNLGGFAKVSYPFFINEGGTYQFAFRSRIGRGDSSTDANDSFIRLVDSAGNPVQPVPNQNVTTSDSWYKVYMNVNGSWSHQASNKDQDPHSLSWNLESGTGYALELSVRSRDHLVDRLILWDTARHNLANTRTGKQPDEAAFHTLDASSTNNAIPPEGDFTNPDDILDILDLVYSWQAANLEPHNNQSIIGWKHATFYTGAMELYQATGNPVYRELLTGIAEEHDWTMLEVNQALWRHADNHLIGETFINLHLDDGQSDPTQVAHVQEIFNRMLTNPWSGRELYDWCDALFMSPPVWAQLAALNNDDRYLAELDRLWWDATDFLYDQEWNLYYRDSSYFNSIEANGKPTFWGRGNGWVIGGLVRLLQYMPEDYGGRQAYVDLYREMIDQLVSLQMDSGGWPSSLLYPERYNFQTEMSATAFFVYGLAWGINNGLLDPEFYGPVAAKGWLQMANYINGDGTIAHIQIVGKEPGPVDDGADKREYGYGAVLLAGVEMAEYYRASDPGLTWSGFPVNLVEGGNWADTGPFMGWLEVTASPFVYSASLDRWVYMEESPSIPGSGSWVYLFTY